MRSVHANMPSCLFATESIAVLHTLSLTYQSSPSCHVVSLGLPKNGCIQLSSTTFNVSRCHGQYSLSTLPALPAAVSLRTSCHQWTSHLSTLRSTHTHTSAWYACIFSVYRIVSLRCAPCMLSRIRIQFASYFVFWEFLFMKGAPCVRLLSCSIVIVVILLFFFALTLFDVEFSASILHWIWIKKAALTGLRARSPAQHWAILLWMSYGLLAFSTHRTAYTAFHTIILLAPCSPPPFIVECKAMFNMAMTSAPWPCMCVRTPIHYAKCRIIRFGLLLHIWEMKKKTQNSFEAISCFLPTWWSGAMTKASPILQPAYRNRSRKIFPDIFTSINLPLLCCWPSKTWSRCESRTFWVLLRMSSGRTPSDTIHDALHSRCWL